MSSSTRLTIARTGCAFRSSACRIFSRAAAEPARTGPRACESDRPVRAGRQKENVMDVNMLLESIRESLHQVGVFLPRLLLAIVILIIGWVIAKAARFAVVKALRAINFSVVTEKAGVDHFLKQGGAHIDTVRVLGTLSYWLVILAALMVASNSLDLAYVTDLVGRIVLFVPKVMFAVVILVFGAYFARFVGSALTTYLHDTHVGEASLIGRLALYAIMVFVIMIALDQMGLGDIIRQAFLIIVAAIGLGLALAFGLGGQKRAAELIERWSRQGNGEEPAARRQTKPVL